MNHKTLLRCPLAIIYVIVVLAGCATGKTEEEFSRLIVAASEVTQFPHATHRPTVGAVLGLRELLASDSPQTAEKHFQETLSRMPSYTGIHTASGSAYPGVLMEVLTPMMVGFRVPDTQFALRHARFALNRMITDAAAAKTLDVPFMLPSCTVVAGLEGKPGIVLGALLAAMQAKVPTLQILQCFLTAGMPGARPPLHRLIRGEVMSQVKAHISLARALSTGPVAEPDFMRAVAETWTALSEFFTASSDGLSDDVLEQYLQFPKVSIFADSIRKERQHSVLREVRLCVT